MKKNETKKLESLFIRGFKITSREGKEVVAVPIGMPLIAEFYMQEEYWKICSFAPTDANAYASEYMNPNPYGGKKIYAVQYYFVKPSITVQEIC